MTVQPILPSFAWGRKKGGDTAAVEDADPQNGSDAEKNVNSPAADRTPSVISAASDEKQTYGVAKVEAITSVWTKTALVVLYILYLSAILDNLGNLIYILVSSLCTSSILCSNRLRGSF